MTPVIASMGREYNPQGPLASSYYGLALYFIATLSIIIFVIRMMRRRHQPPRSFSFDCVLAFIPILCATAYLVLGVLRILEMSSRVHVSRQLLEQRIRYDLRPLAMALAVSALMFLLMLLMKVVIKRRESKMREQASDASQGEGSS